MFQTNYLRRVSVQFEDRTKPFFWSQPKNIDFLPAKEKIIRMAADDLELVPGKKIGRNHQTFIIAEIGQNHQGIKFNLFLSNLRRLI